MERIESEVRQELARLGPSGAIGAIVEAWPAAVGEMIAANAWPARVARDGTLHVAASSSTWAFELSQLAPQILERLREPLGESTPAGLRFALGHVPERIDRSPPQAAAQRPSPTPEHEARATEFAASISDEKLRELVKKAAILSLTKASAVGPF
jgi:predicted nucleic acid-binding Zn ribbon protein